MSSMPSWFPAALADAQAKDALAETIEIIKQTMIAAGISLEVDPHELPERISELRFVGTMFVSRETYPRSNPLSGPENKPETAPGRTPRLDRGLKSLAGYMT
jgi:hypothetical protein